MMRGEKKRERAGVTLRGKPGEMEGDRRKRRRLETRSWRDGR